MNDFKQQIAAAAQAADERWNKENYDGGYCTISFTEGANFGLKLALNSPEVREVREALQWAHESPITERLAMATIAFDQLLKEVGE